MQKCHGLVFHQLLINALLPGPAAEAELRLAVFTDGRGMGLVSPAVLRLGAGKKEFPAVQKLRHDIGLFRIFDVPLLHRRV